MKRRKSDVVRTRSRAFRRDKSGARAARRLSALVLVAFLIGVVPVLAATVDIDIPLETVVFGEAGSQHVLAAVEVPAESRGEVCQVTATARNQDSEHPDSDLLISSLTDVEILDVENTAYGSVFGGGEITLSDTVTVILTLGADRVYSGGFDLVIDCPPFNPTTTTTLVVEVTTVSEAPTTSSAATIPEVTSSSVPPSEDTTSSSGADGEGEASSVSSSVLGTSITAPEASVAATSETLPLTGLADGAMGGVAFALVALGGLMVLSLRRRETELTVAEEWQTRIDFYDVSF